MQEHTRPPTEAAEAAAAARTAMDGGHWDRARRLALEGAGLARDVGAATAAVEAGLVLARIEAARGEAAACRDHLAGVLDAAEVAGIATAAARSTAVLGFLELGRRRPDAAIGHLLSLVGPGRPASVRADPPGTWLADLVEAAVHAGRRGLAVAVLERAGKDASASAAVRASLARIRGLLARPAELDVEFERALALHRAEPRPFERARTELCYGEVLRRARRRTEAREQLRAALATFEALRAEPWAERARIELGATTETARKRRHRDHETLTPQERAVARLVALGATNREVAEALFLSPRTIEFHLGNAFGKLGVRTRTQLALRMQAELVA